MSHTKRSFRTFHFLVTCSTLAAAFGAFGCEDESKDPDAPNSATGTVQSGGNTAGAAGSVGADTERAGVAGSVGADTGGAGAAGSAGGAGIGGTAATTHCLSPLAHQSYLTISKDFPFCVVAIHSTQEALFAKSSNPPTWGNHHGPLTLTPPAKGSNEITLARWHFPSDPQGPSTVEKQAFTPTDLPTGMVFWGPALDLPFEGWTLFSYTSTDTASSGEILFADASLKIKARGHVNGFFSSVGIHSGPYERLLYTGLSSIEAKPTTTKDNGLYAADVCNDSSHSTKPFCYTTIPLASWQTSSGPVVSDQEGTVFVTMGTFGGEQEVRAFVGGTRPGDAGLINQTVWKDKNFTLATAAVAPTSNGPGYLFIEEGDPMTSAPLPTIAVEYTRRDNQITASNSTKNALTPQSAKNTAYFTTDEQGTLWVALDDPTAKPPHGVFLGLRRTN